MDGKAVHQYPKNLFFAAPSPVLFFQGGLESGACYAGLSDFEKAFEEATEPSQALLRQS